jgi:hypothetical protein
MLSLDEPHFPVVIGHNALGSDEPPLSSVMASKGACSPMNSLKNPSMWMFLFFRALLFLAAICNSAQASTWVYYLKNFFLSSENAGKLNDSLVFSRLPSPCKGVFSVSACLSGCPETAEFGPGNGPREIRLPSDPVADSACDSSPPGAHILTPENTWVETGAVQSRFGSDPLPLESVRSWQIGNLRNFMPCHVECRRQHR